MNRMICNGLMVVLLMLTLGLVVILAGCDQPAPKSPVWAEGDLPLNFVEFFGDGNGARLDFMQNQVLDNHSKMLTELARRVIVIEGDPNAVPLETRIEHLERKVHELTFVGPIDEPGPTTENPGG